ncbi:hypothetical protein J4Q44_G00016450 [Coregonus suidteri]|uniref:GPI mannosyltransferase 2 n=1 Tax=Coregonus suidteri TaxID=861788 RepID=A0AAN8R5I4_9TELE
MDVKTVLQFAATTRGLSLLIQALLNAAIPDHEADAFTPPPAEVEPRLLDPAVQWFLGAFPTGMQSIFSSSLKGVTCMSTTTPSSPCSLSYCGGLQRLYYGPSVAVLHCVDACYWLLPWALSKIWGLHKDNNRHNKCFHYTWIVARLLFTAALGTAVIALPFLVFQYYGYRAFCTPSLSLEQVSPALIQLAEDKGYRVPDENAPPPLWCLRPLPLLYSHIQDVYWDVGFLRYFQLKQIPNFLLALPMATLGMAAAYMYYRDNPARCLRLGLWDEGANKRPDKPTPGFYSPRVFLYVVHATMLLGFGTFCMHVQVLTRFLSSSSPVPFWISAHLLLLYEPLLQRRSQPTSNKGQQRGTPRTVFLYLPQNPIVHLLSRWKTCSIPTRWILGYFISYWLMGLALHCNFLPWT